MTSSDRIEALLSLADPERTATPEMRRQLMVLGLAEPHGKGGHRPSSAGWTELGSLGRPFRDARPLRL